MALLAHQRSDAARFSTSELARIHQRALQRAFVAGQQCWGSLPLSFPIYAERFLELVLRRLAAAGLQDLQDLLGATLERSAGADLYLAIACDQRAAGAWEAFSLAFRPRLLQLARRHGLDAAAAEELVQDLLGDLLSPPAHAQASTRIGTYDGTGSLFAWLTVVLLRRAADRSERRRLHENAKKEILPIDAGDAAAPSAEDPLAGAIDAEMGAALHQTLTRVFAELTPQERLALLFRFRDGIAQNQIARVLGTSESRVSRVLSSAIDKLRERLRARLRMLDAGGRQAPWRVLHDVLSERLQESGSPTDLPRDGAVDP